MSMLLFLFPLLITTGSLGYGKPHIKECMGNFKLSPKLRCNKITRSDFLCFWGVWGQFSCDLRRSTKH